MDTAMEGQWGTADVIATATATSRAPNSNMRYEFIDNPDDSV